LVILDIIMPQMDGFELYDQLRKIEHNVKVCFITAFRVNYEAMRAIFPTAIRIDDIECFILKPPHERGSKRLLICCLIITRIN
jgi:CheY-like chemotaxis protein